ncbi:hypothetical protein ACJEBK_28120, partial [Peribacillus frigoritolerans]
MLFIFVFNLLFSIILFVSQPKENEANRWMIAFAMSAGIGALSESLVSDIIPTLQKMEVIFLLPFLFQVHIYFQFLGEVISPYAILMYSIVYSKIVMVEIKKKLSYILAIPMVFMVFVTD